MFQGPIDPSAPSAEAEALPALATVAPDAWRRRRLRAMQHAAVALLVAMALLFIVSQAQGGRPGAWGGWVWIAAFAEAALVGALADWFAVVALFRHPMGIPLWHTAIVPRRKDDIARHLGEFIESHFVSVEAVLSKVRAFDPAGRLAAWLQQPRHQAALAAALAGALRHVLVHWDDTALRQRVRLRLSQALGSIDPMPFAARWAAELVAEGRHQQALDWALRRAERWLESDDAVPTLAQVLDSVDHVLVSALSGRIAAVMRNGALRLARAALADPDHVLRQRLDGWTADAVRRLADDATWAERVRRFQHELLASDRFDASVDALWSDLKSGLVDELSGTDPSPLLAQLIGRLGAALDARPGAHAALNDAMCEALAPVVERNRGAVAAYVQSQIDAWSQEQLTERVELAIGRDLQFIRVNGTVVGGLAGLALHAATLWLRA